MTGGEDSVLIAAARDAAGYPPLGVMPRLDRGIHEAAQRLKPYGCRLLLFFMDCRVKPGNDARRGRRVDRGLS
jgi:hypothetical protein